jgi:hypothetical protein
MPRMELIAGEVQDILVVLGTAGDRPNVGRERFAAYLPLGGAIDPTWLDLFSESARITTDSSTPTDFIDARIELGAEEGRLTIERVDPAWISAIARLPDGLIDAVTGRWIDRIEEEIGELPREEKPWIRELAGQVVVFCRTADRAPDVVFVWALR